MDPLFFKTAKAFRKWLSNNHGTEKELWVGYYKKATKLPSMTWSESVDEAICFGWIDGLRKKIDEQSYKIRFTPRNPRSHWSAVNIEKVKRLTQLGLMQPAGIEAFKKIENSNSKKASYEQQAVTLHPDFEKQIKRHPKAWVYFDKLAPSYKKATIHWVMSAKQEATKLRRLAVLIKSSEEGKKISMLRRK